MVFHQFPIGFLEAKYNWDFYTVPQRHMDGRRLHQPRGRALGGSSSLNAMAYVPLGLQFVGVSALFLHVFGLLSSHFRRFSMTFPRFLAFYLAPMRRGHALDYERWASEIGEGGDAWSYRLP